MATIFPATIREMLFIWGTMPMKFFTHLITGTKHLAILMAVVSITACNPDLVTPDTTSPTLKQVTPVAVAGTDTTPSYTFSSTEAGTIIYGGSCSSTTNKAVKGNNTITFNELLAGTYSNCTIKVKDASGNASSILGINTFTVRYGIVTTALSTAADTAQDVLVQPDGKILVAGSGYSLGVSNNPVIALIRYNADGTLDSTFSDDGIVMTKIGNYGDGGKGLALQSDGKILVVGSHSTSSSPDIAVLRYNPDGVLDSSFGVGGIVTTAVGTGTDFGQDIVIQPNGKILVAGYSDTTPSDFIYNFALVRYNTDGSLDSTFSGDGKLTTAIGSFSDFTGSLTLQSDDKILVAGVSYNGSDRDFALVRYNTDGSLDSTFSGDGKLTTAIGLEGDEVSSVAVQADGKIIVAGKSVNAGYDYNAVVRYNTDGSLDNTFSDDGIVTTLNGLNSLGQDVVLQPDGKILVAGEGRTDVTYGHFGVVRYNTDGSLDNTFSNDGMVITAIAPSNSDQATGITLQSNGKILAAGYTVNPGNDWDFALVRYNADGSLDTTFGTN
jgi:uncharacterized delta-60 repeat protein